MSLTNNFLNCNIQEIANVTRDTAEFVQSAITDFNGFTVDAAASVQASVSQKLDGQTFGVCAI